MRGNLLWMVAGLAAVVIGLVACGAPPGPSIRAEDVWARPAMTMTEMQVGELAPGSMEMGGMAGTGAVFMRLRNGGRTADRLIGGQTAVAEAVEVHETIMENEVMKMRMLQDGLEVPAGSDVLLEPGSYHIMLIGMRRSLGVGDRFELELEFEVSGRLTVEAEVREP